jgi:hypothetical protein
MKEKIVVGIWDTQQVSKRMGDFLIFQEELLLQQAVAETPSIDLVILKHDSPVPTSFLATLSQLNPSIKNLIFLNEEKDLSLIKDHYGEENILFWPPENQKDGNSYTESTLALQTMYQQHGELIHLKMPTSVQVQAKKWLKKYVETSIPIAVHLKNNPHDPQSNAQIDNWLNLFEYCQSEKLPVVFILIGNDVYDDRCYQQSNVRITQMLGGQLELDLALIQLSYLFMGMSSGPCNMALFCGVPYLIWKHPGHHVKEMEKEFQGHSQFMFANEFQQFFRDWDSSENLIQAFKDLYFRLEPEKWRL